VLMILNSPSTKKAPDIDIVADM
ncbi:hypothetical protein CCACVL1_00279, partial [Corchorus capsularis]